jgi:hypothetical protein
MKALLPRLQRQRRLPPSAAMNSVFELDRTRIERALAGRNRYKYVQPRVDRHDSGWIVSSPNCSRNVDAQGGEIPIAWFEPDGSGRWRVHARDHAAGQWQRKAQGLTLPDALQLVCTDAQREFWV